MRRYYLILLGLAIAGSCHARVPFWTDDEGAVKLLHGEQVYVLRSSTATQTWITVSFKGNVTEFKYSDVKVQAFASDGKEIPIAHHGKDLAYGSFPKEAGGDPNVYTGDYETIDGTAHIARVRVAWQGEQVDFPTPTPSKNPAFKALHGEQVRIIAGWDAEGRAVLEVVFRGSERGIKYNDVKLQVFNRDGKEIPMDNCDFFKTGTYTNNQFGKYLGDEDLGGYKPRDKNESISRITIAWKGEAVEFSLQDAERGFGMPPEHR